MQAIIFMGIPASGKSSFYKDRFADTHVRINRDMLGTAHRQRVLLEACCGAGIRFVLDNTNVAAQERAGAILAAKEAGFTVTGYFFESKIEPCVARNALRAVPVPEEGVRGRRNALTLPRRDEGFDTLWFVRICDDGTFDVSAYEDEVSL